MSDDTPYQQPLTVKDVEWSITGTPATGVRHIGRIYPEGGNGFIYGDIEDQGKEYPTNRFRTSDESTHDTLAAAKQHEMSYINQRLVRDGYLASLTDTAIAPTPDTPAVTDVDWKARVVETTLDALRQDVQAPAIRYTEPPFNVATGNILSPANAWFVGSVLAERNAQSAAVMTFNQARDLGLGIEKGAKGIPIFVPNTTPNQSNESAADNSKNSKDSKPSLRMMHVYSLDDVVGAPSLQRPEGAQTELAQRAPGYLLDLLDRKERSGEIEVREGASRAFVKANGLANGEKPIVAMPDYDVFSSTQAQAVTLARLLAHVEITKADIGHDIRTLSEKPDREINAYRHLVAGLSASMTCQQAGLMANPEQMASLKTVGFAPLEEAGHDVNALGHAIIRDARAISRSLLEQMPELKQDIGARVQEHKDTVIKAGLERTQARDAARMDASGLSPSEFSRVTDLAKETLRSPMIVGIPESCEKGKIMGSVAGDQGNTLWVIGLGKGQLTAIDETVVQTDTPLAAGAKVAFTREGDQVTLCDLTKTRKPTLAAQEAVQEELEYE